MKGIITEWKRGRNNKYQGEMAKEKIKNKGENIMYRQGNISQMKKRM